jgi:aspartate kinase
MALIVQKFGGTSVRSIERIKKVAERCMESQAKGNGLVVVVSAMAGETNRLIELASDITDTPSPREMDVLVTTGEQVSIALLSIAINAAGGHARSFVANQIGLRTDNLHGKARIQAVESKKMHEAMSEGAIVVVAGFQGVDEDGNITTLGRGGSDTSAVALAAALDADVCEIYTDVDGIYTTDPGMCDKAQKIDRISFEEMLELASLGAKVLQVRSVEFAMKYNVPIHVRSSFTSDHGSWVCAEEESMEEVVVRGVACDRDAAKITIQSVRDVPGIAAQIFEPLSAAGINVDVILQNVSFDTTTDLTFTVSSGDLVLAEQITQDVMGTLGTTGVSSDSKVAKVSVVGAGMRSHSGVAATAFRALAKAGINIQMISTSEIKISCVVHEDDAEDAVRALHSEFGLDTEA